MPAPVPGFVRGPRGIFTFLPPPSESAAAPVSQRPSLKPKAAIQSVRMRWARPSNEFTIVNSFVVDSRNAQGPASPGLVRSVCRLSNQGSKKLQLMQLLGAVHFTTPASTAVATTITQ